MRVIGKPEWSKGLLRFLYLKIKERKMMQV